MESLKQITPILDFDYKKFIFSYTYTHQIGDITFDSGGFHQITLGINMLCKKQRATGCPNVNLVY